MKKPLCVIILLIMFLTCSCSSKGIKDDSLVFYYPRSAFLYDTTDGVIGFETRQIDMRNLSVEEIIGIYLEGPKETDYICYLSNEIELLECRTDNTGLHITFSTNLSDLLPTELSLSLCALSKTLFQITDVQSICIHANETLLDGEQKIVFTRDNIYLWDSFANQIPETIITETNGDSK